MADRLVRVSRYLALRLRHDPYAIGLELDASGWVDIDALLDASRRHGFPISRRELDATVAANGKRRYETDASGTRIRARQGHSVPVDLGLEATRPPAILFHGTVERVLDQIGVEGLRPMGRQHVHLSADRATATTVGARRGRPIVLDVRAGEMADDGFAFWLSTNGVWLTAAVPARYLDW